MEWFEYLIIVAVIIFVGSVSFVTICNKIKGKSSCGGHCDGCKSACACHAKDRLKEYIESK